MTFFGWTIGAAATKINRIEQDHRGIKQRYYPMLGFKSFRSAQRFCHSLDELRNYFRPRQRCHQVVPAARRREQFRTKVEALPSAFLAHREPPADPKFLGSFSRPSSRHSSGTSSDRSVSGSTSKKV